MKQKHHQRGIITLLTLMLMAVITSLAVTASVLMVNELRMTETIGQGIVSSYAAEAGMEDGLYTLKEDRDSGKALNNGSDDAITDQTNAQTLSNNSSWARTAGLETSFNITRLSRDQTATLDYFNADDPSIGAGIESIKVDWGDNCSQASWLETSMTSFSYIVGMGFDFSPSQHIYKDAQGCIPNGTRCTSITFNDVGLGGNIIAGGNYRFGFRVLDIDTSNSCKNTGTCCDLENLTVTGYNDDNAMGDVVDIPAHLTIKSIGSFGNTQQAITASVPWKAPMSGLASFVLFSEQDITK